MEKFIFFRHTFPTLRDKEVQWSPDMIKCRWQGTRKIVLYRVRYTGILSHTFSYNFPEANNITRYTGVLVIWGLSSEPVKAYHTYSFCSLVGNFCTGGLPTFLRRDVSRVRRVGFSVSSSSSRAVPDINEVVFMLDTPGSVCRATSKP